MAFDSTGKYNRLYNWVADRDASIKILADRMDNEFDGIANALTAIVQGNQAFKGALRAIDGIETKPGITFDADQATGLWRTSSGDIAVSVSGAEKFRVTSSGASVSGDFSISGDASVAGNISVFGTVDGRDVSTDGAKLDKITVSDPIDLGNVVQGPASSTDSNFATFDGATGKMVKDSGKTASDFISSANGSVLPQHIDTTQEYTFGKLTSNDRMKLTGANPYFYIKETDSGAYAQIIMKGGALYIEASKPDGSSDAYGYIRLAGYGENDLVGQQIKYAGAWQWVWHDGNFPARIAALTENTSPTGTEMVACSDGKKVRLGNIGPKVATSGALSFDFSSSHKNSFAHGLGQKPDLVTIELVAKTANNGFSVGDSIFLYQSYSRYYGMQIDSWANDSTAGYNAHKQSVGLLVATNDDPVARFTPSSTDWDLYIHAIIL